MDPRPPRPFERVVLNAVIGTYAEADIIGATVANALTQGCDRVLLVDNGSPDDTVTRAEAAGADLAARYVTDEYVEAERMAHLNAVTRRAGAEAVDDGACGVWWLFLDADELPHGPRGRTIRRHLEGLDRTIDTVGSRTFDHYPDRVPANTSGHHPIDHQPLCQERPDRACAAGHWKHPLIRVDPDGPPLTMGAGFHRVEADHRLTEAADPIITHHFNFRNEHDTRARMDLLTAAPDGSKSRIATDTWALSRRPANLDAVYACDWPSVDLTRSYLEGTVLEPRPWPEIAPDGHAEIARWY